MCLKSVTGIAAMCRVTLIAFFACGQHAAFADDSAALTAVLARLEVMQNFTARFDVETVMDFDPAVLEQLPEEDRNVASLRRTEREQVTFRFLRGRARAESTLDPRWKAEAKEKGIRAPELEIITIAPDRAEQLVRHPGSRRASGSISGTMKFPEPWTVDLGVGVRLLGEPTWLSEQDLRAAKVLSDDKEGLTLQIIGTNGVIQELRFEKRWGYALVSYRVGSPENGMDVVCSNFAEVAGVFVPFKIERIRTYKDSAGKIRHPLTRTVIVREFVIDDPGNTAESFLIAWPAGSRVIDTRTGEVIPVGPTTRALTDAAISDAAAQRRKERHELEEEAQRRIRRALEATSDSASTTKATTPP